MSAITNFYSGAGTDQNGRTLADIQAFDFRTLERDHQYIQWLFPLPEASRFNTDAPILTREDMEAFRAAPQMQSNLMRSLAIMASFYGFTGNEQKTGLVRRKEFDQCAANWLTPNNHNFLRISRILRSASLLGLQEPAKEFLRVLEDVYNDGGKHVIPPRTLQFWRNAVSPPEVPAPAPAVPPRM